MNSGSSANLLTIFCLKSRFPEGGEIIVPPLTWSSDIASILHAGFDPVFVDIDPKTLGMDNNKIFDALTSKTVAVFLTHCRGFLMRYLMSYLMQSKGFVVNRRCM